LWNQIVRRWELPQEIMPCEGSFLHSLFMSTGVSVAPAAALSVGTFETLTRSGPLITPLRRLAERLAKSGVG
jgi:hypothetical protein